jgi:hypothetical protein
MARLHMQQGALRITPPCVFSAILDSTRAVTNASRTFAAARMVLPSLATAARHMVPTSVLHAIQITQKLEMHAEEKSNARVLMVMKPLELIVLRLELFIVQGVTKAFILGLIAPVKRTNALVMGVRLQRGKNAVSTTQRSASNATRVITP